MKERIVFILIILLAINTSTQAQRKVEQVDPEKQAEQQAQKSEDARLDKTKWMDNVSFGGNLGGGISSGSSFFMLQPMAFYRFTDNTMAGLGVSYYYWSLEYYTSNNRKDKISDHAYGINLFARQQLFDPVFLHAEYMPLNFKVYNPYNNEINREWVSSLYLGGGINQQISNRSGYYILFLYDVLYNAARSFRGTPIDIRTGFYF
jgi:hypothetical protein